VNSFGRNDGFWVGKRKAKDNGNGNCKSNCNDRNRSLRDDNKKDNCKGEVRVLSAALLTVKR
jgi:hypothetical protein